MRMIVIVINVYITYTLATVSFNKWVHIFFINRHVPHLNATKTQQINQLFYQNKYKQINFKNSKKENIIWGKWPKGNIWK